MKTQQKQIVLDESQKQEIKMLVNDLIQHKKEYQDFKSFVKTCDDALNIANALLNNDFKTFKRYSLKYSNHTAEKMRGIQSLSTYKKTSSICNFLSLHDGICKKCYAEKSLSLYKATLKPQMIYNTLLLKYIDIDAQQIPYINNKYFRFESFSDLQGSKHFKNLLQVCKKNKNTLFTLWTKAGFTLVKMMDQENIKKLPSNLNIIVSEFYINKCKYTAEDLRNLQSCLKTKNNLKCFVVFDDENKRQKSNMYLCKNKCLDCLKCYKKSKQIIYIAEKLH